MRYLYGDSSESTLEINYLAFLRDAIDFGVAVLQADHGLAVARERRTNRDRAAEETARSLEQFGRVALDVVEPYAVGEQPLNRCAASVVAAINEAVRREVAKVRSGQGTDADQIVGELQRLREKCVAALGTLVATHDLPDADETLVVQWNGSAYDARMVQRVGFGLEVTMTLDVPPSSLFGHDLRVEKVADGTEVHVPESRGVLKKEMKMVPHKLGRHHVTHVTVATNGTTVRVRATPEAGAPGFDILVARNGNVTVERTGKTDGGEATFDTDERDVTGLRGLAAKLEAAVDGLRGSRGALVSATLDGKALAAHEHPSMLVQRLVSAMAPVVHEIARHSLSPRELVIKRLLGGDRREEIFLSRAELVAKITVLPPKVQQVFAPLGIVDAAPVASEREARDSREITFDIDDAPVRPMPAVESRTARSTAPPPPHHTEPETPSIVIQAEAPPMPQGPPPVPPPRAGSPFPPASDLPGVPAAAAPPAAEEAGPAITLEADLPPARVRPGSLPPLPPLSSSGTTPPPPRSKGKTVPPPAPPQRMSVAATEAAVDAALRDLDDGEPTQVVSSAPRPPQLE